MSIKRLSDQGSLFETKTYLGSLLENQKGSERFLFFHKYVWPILHKLEDKLCVMYCNDNGRPAVNPVRLLAVTILQFMEKVPDRRAVEEVVFDLRWKYALGMDVDEKGFHHTVLVRFRERLLEHNLEGIGFETALDAMRKAGYLRKKNAQRIDSTHILGAVALMSRLECVRVTTRLALQWLETQQNLFRPEEWPLWWERYIRSKPNYKEKTESIRLKMVDVGKDIFNILSWVDELPEEICKAEPIKLLRRVFEENFKIDDDLSVTPLQQQTSKNIKNPHDTEAHWSKKNTSKIIQWVGYKAQIAETVEDEICSKGEPTKSVITAIVTQDAIFSDKASLPEVEKRLKECGEAIPTKLYVDAGYTSGFELARAFSEGREIRGPMQPAPKKANRYCAEDFDVSIKKRMAICPAGKRSTNFSTLHEKKTDKDYCRIEWKNTICGECKLRIRCLGENQKHKTLNVTAHHDLTQQRRLEQKTNDFKIDMHKRNAIEGTISELCRGYGLRKSRYRGKAKTRLQLNMTGAACNIIRWWRRWMWENLGKLPEGMLPQMV